MMDYVFEAVDTTNDESGYTLGVFSSLSELMRSISSNPEQCPLSEWNTGGESGEIRVLRRKINEPCEGWDGFIADIDVDLIEDKKHGTAYWVCDFSGLIAWRTKWERGE